MIGEDLAHVLGTRDVALLRHQRVGPIGADHGAGTDRVALGLAVLVADLEMDQCGVVLVALDPGEGAGAASSAGRDGAVAQPFVEDLTVDHADIAAADLDIDVAVGG